MKSFIVAIIGLVLFNGTAGAVMMAPWTRAGMPFGQVLEYLNENSLIVVSLAYSKNSGSSIDASVICPNREFATLVFDVSHLAQGTEISLNSVLSEKCN